MKMKDYEDTLELSRSEIDDVYEQLSKIKDKSSEEYRNTLASLNALKEDMFETERCKSERLSGKIPSWATALFGSTLGVIFGAVVLKVEKAGGVVSSQAISLWDRVIRKF